MEEAYVGVVPMVNDNELIDLVSNNKLNYAENFLIRGGTAKDLLHDPTYLSLSEKEEQLTIKKRVDIYSEKKTLYSTKKFFLSIVGRITDQKRR